jgi:glycosyltransferase involved in cell wall biosynthesis
MMFNFYYPKTSRPCGVEDFSRSLEVALTHGQEGQGGDCLVLNFPLVSWKKVLFAPIFMLFKAMLQGHKRLIILHEWKDLDWKRRWFIAPNLFFATHVLFSSPYVRQSFEIAFFAKFITQKRGCIPIPASLKRVLPLLPTAHGEKIQAMKQSGKLVIGHFGSIYARKQSLVLLDIAAQLKAKGEDVFLVFMGAFIKSGDNVEALFNAKLTQYGLQNDVLVTGFLETNNDVFALAQHMDYFIYTFEEGLTSRRSSVLAVVQSGKPLIVPEAIRVDEFAHHAIYSALIKQKAIEFVPRGSAAPAYVVALTALKTRAQQEITQKITQDITFEYDVAWQNAAQAVQQIMAD